MSQTFNSANDFRKSLEMRLQQKARSSGTDLSRLQRSMAFERLLARLFSQEDSPFFLKGGYAMELRVAQPRATRDIDLTCLSRVTSTETYLSQMIVSELRRLAAVPMEDYFGYQIGEAKQDLENAPYGGARYPVRAIVAGRLFSQFQLDVGADVIIGPPEKLSGKGGLEFCGIPAPVFKAIAVEQQFAEKIHAYTLPRPGGRNTRVKDLIDLVLLVHAKVLNPERLLGTLLVVFKVRRSHPMPSELPQPPMDWHVPFANLAAECGLSLTLDEAFAEVSERYLSIQSVRGHQDRLAFR